MNEFSPAEKTTGMQYAPYAIGAPSYPEGAQPGGALVAAAEPARNFLTDLIERIMPLDSGEKKKLQQKTAPAESAYTKAIRAASPIQGARDFGDLWKGHLTNLMETLAPLSAKKGAEYAGENVAEVPKTFGQQFPADPRSPQAMALDMINQGGARGASPKPAPAREASPGGALAGAPGMLPTGPMPPLQDLNAGPQGALATLPSMQPTQAEAMPARKSISKMYREAIDRLPKEANGKLTDDQRSRIAMEFFLGMMANSSRPGAYMLGAAGEAGLAATGRARSEEEKNLAHSQAEINRLRDEVYKQIGLEDKDQDNVRADKRADTEERRWAAAEERDKKRLDAETKRLEGEGKNVIGHQVLANGNIGLMTRDGRVVDSGAKAKASASEVDPLSRGMETLRRYFPNESNEQLFQRVLGTKRDTGRGELSEDELIREAAKLSAGSMGSIPLADAVAQLRKERDNLRGGAPAGGGRAVSRASPIYKDALADPRVGGDKAKLEAMLAQKGIKVTD